MGVTGLRPTKYRRHIKHNKLKDPARFEFTDDDCLIVVNRKLNADGYYRRRIEGGRLVMNHRYVWEELNGPVPQGMEVNHKCRNRACCNPDHLEVLDIGYHKTITNLSRDFKIGEWAKEGNRKDFT